MKEFSQKLFAYWSQAQWELVQTIQPFNLTLPLENIWYKFLFILHFYHTHKRYIAAQCTHWFRRNKFKYKKLDAVITFLAGCERLVIAGCRKQWEKSAAAKIRSKGLGSHLVSSKIAGRQSVTSATRALGHSPTSACRSARREGAKLSRAEKLVPKVAN